MFYSFWEGQGRPSELSTEQFAEREMQRKERKEKIDEDEGEADNTATRLMQRCEQTRHTTEHRGNVLPHAACLSCQLTSNYRWFTEKKNNFTHNEHDVECGHAMIEIETGKWGCGSPGNASSKSHLHTYHAILMAVTASADEDWWDSSARVRRFLLLRLLGNIGPRGIVR